MSKRMQSLLASHHYAIRRVWIPPESRKLSARRNGSIKYFSTPVGSGDCNLSRGLFQMGDYFGLVFLSFSKARSSLIFCLQSFPLKVLVLAG